MHQHEIVETRNGYRLQRKDGTTDPNERLYTTKNDEGASITYDLNRMTSKQKRDLGLPQ